MEAVGMTSRPSGSDITLRGPIEGTSRGRVSQGRHCEPFIHPLTLDG